jgi:hypothetical protein
MHTEQGACQVHNMMTRVGKQSQQQHIDHQVLSMCIQVASRCQWVELPVADMCIPESDSMLLLCYDKRSLTSSSSPPAVALVDIQDVGR